MHVSLHVLQSITKLHSITKNSCINRTAAVTQLLSSYTPANSCVSRTYVQTACKSLCINRSS